MLPGAVTPFGIINDKDRKVKWCWTATCWGQDPVNAHPLVNTMTTASRPGGPGEIPEAEGHQPEILDLSRPRDAGRRVIPPGPGLPRAAPKGHKLNIPLKPRA